MSKDQHASLRPSFVEEKGYTEEEYRQLSALYEGTLGKISQGEIVKGRIVHISDNEVSLDIGFKSEGTVAKAEFAHIEELKVGDEVEVFLENIEDKDGQLVLSRKRADFMRIWERVTRSFETGEVLKGRILRRIKGGLVVDLLSIDAFLPGSQIDVRPVRDFDALIGKEMDFKIIKMSEAEKKIGLSIRALGEDEERNRLEEYQRRAAAATMTIEEVMNLKSPGEGR